MLRESERLYTALLNSISHELRTPIATITGAAEPARIPDQRRHPPPDRTDAFHSRLCQPSQSPGGKPARYVTARRRPSASSSWTGATSAKSSAWRRSGSKTVCIHRPLNIDVPPDLPLVQMDFVLMEQVLVNLLDNACNYSPPEAPITIEAHMNHGKLMIAVTDGGKGIPPGDLERIFDKFYRVPGTATGGTGLGLSICRGLVEAHGGTLTAENAPEAAPALSFHCRPAHHHHPSRRPTCERRITRAGRRR